MMRLHVSKYWTDSKSKFTALFVRGDISSVRAEGAEVNVTSPVPSTIENLGLSKLLQIYYQPFWK